MKPKSGRLVLAGALLLSLGVSVVASAQLVGQNPDFDSVAAEEEAYWYSRYSLGHLTMRSGMGEAFVPDEAMIDMMVNAADADPNDGDTLFNVYFAYDDGEGASAYWINMAMEEYDEFGYFVDGVFLPDQTAMNNFN